MQMESLAQDLAHDRKWGKTEVTFGGGRQRGAALERPSLDPDGECLHLAAAHRLISGILAGLNGGWFARGPGCGKRCLACRAAHRHVLADDLAKGQQAQGEEQQDEGDDGPFDHGLSRLPALHGDDPGWKRSIVCTH